MAPLRTLAALALSVGAVSGFAPATNFATKKATRYDIFSLSEWLFLLVFHANVAAVRAS